MLAFTLNRLLTALTLLGLFALLPGQSAFAESQDATEITPPPGSDPPAEETQPEPAPDDATLITPPPSAPRTMRPTAELLDPDLLSELYSRWIPMDSNAPPVTDGGNVTILSVPTDYAVYLAPVEALGIPAEPGLPPPSIEGVVFESRYLIGHTPVTARVPPGDYCLAVRATSRHTGFDGGCVSKSTYDLITGGHRYSYHLYPLRKVGGQYQCFVANFVWRDCSPEDIGEEIARRGAFNFDIADLTALVIERTSAPTGEIPRIARELNQLGIAFYNMNDYDYLVKATLVGNHPEVMEWRVE